MAWVTVYEDVLVAGMDRSVIIWLLIPTVFAMRDIFELVAKGVMEDGLWRLDELGLPIAERVACESLGVAVYDLLCAKIFGNQC